MPGERPDGPRPIAKLSKRGSAAVRVVLGGFWHLYPSLGAQLSQGWVPQPGPESFRAGQARLFDTGGERVFRTAGLAGVDTYLDDLHLNPEIRRQMRGFYRPFLRAG